MSATRHTSSAMSGSCSACANVLRSCALCFQPPAVAAVTGSWPARLPSRRFSRRRLPPLGLHLQPVARSAAAVLQGRTVARRLLLLQPRLRTSMLLPRLEALLLHLPPAAPTRRRLQWPARRHHQAPPQQRFPLPRLLACPLRLIRAQLRVPFLWRRRLACLVRTI